MLKNIRSRTGTRDSRSIALTVKDIPIGDISIKGNIRREYTGIEELAESIRQHGLLQPITVYADGDSYTVKTGHRRYLACKMLYGKEPERFHRIRRIVSDAANTAVIQLVENVQRVDLSQTDLFNALTGLRAQGMTLRQIADVMGKTEQYIKFLFIGVNELINNDKLKERISIAGNTIQDIVETKGIPDEKERFNLLEERKNGTINRAEMREKVKQLKIPESKADAPVTNVDSEKPQKIHVSIKSYPDMNKIIIYQVKGGKTEQVISIEKDLREYFAVNNAKYCLVKTLPEGGTNGKQKQR
jgi:ParB family chromosome partitioning protein